MKCERCGFETEYKSSLVRHLKTKQECECILSTKSRDDLIAEITKKEYNEITYKCRYCDKKFNKNQNRWRHEKLHNREATDNSLNSFGAENMDYISEDFIEKCLRRKHVNWVLCIVNKIYFDADHPENHNVRKDSVYIDKQWQPETTNKIVDKIIDNVCKFLENHTSDHDTLLWIDDIDGDELHSKVFQILQNHI